VSPRIHEMAKGVEIVGGAACVVGKSAGLVSLVLWSL
jgi:hypothetical protein